MEARLIRIREVMRMTGLARSTIWRNERCGEFPSRIRLGKNSVAWRYEEVRAWCDSREVVRRPGAVSYDSNCA